MQRVFAAPNVRAARNTVILGNSIAVTASLLFFLSRHRAVRFLPFSSRRLAPSLANDAIFPYFIANELPHGIVGLIVAGLFAASMGALSSTINAMAAIVVSDFQGTFFPRATPAAQVGSSRLHAGRRDHGNRHGVLSGEPRGALALGTVPEAGGPHRRRIPRRVCAGPADQRATSAGVMIGAVASIGVTGWVQSYTSTSAFFHGFVAISSCMVIGYLASLFIGRRKDPATLRGLVIWALPAAK